MSNTFFQGGKNLQGGFAACAPLVTGLLTRLIERLSLLSFVTCTQSRNEGGAIPGGGESLWGEPNHCGGSRIIVGGAESLRGEPKSPNDVTCTYFNRRFASERPQFRTWGRKTCCLPRAPSNLVTPLHVPNVLQIFPEKIKL